MARTLRIKAACWHCQHGIDGVTDAVFLGYLKGMGKNVWEFYFEDGHAETHREVC